MNEDLPLPKLGWLGALCLCVANESFAGESGCQDARDCVLAPLHLDRHALLLAGEAAVATAVAGLITNPEVRSTATTDQSAWFPTGGESSPSGHTDAAFAAHSSAQGKQHWPSDTIAGTVLGIATGRSISYQGADSENKQAFRIAIHPLKGGAMLRFSVDPERLLKP
jgi:membrane-associated phospholipid phosphatase